MRTSGFSKSISLVETTFNLNFVSVFFHKETFITRTDKKHTPKSERHKTPYYIQLSITSNKQKILSLAEEKSLFEVFKVTKLTLNKKI